MTPNKRIMVMLPPELEERLYELRRTEAYCRMSYSEIIRMMFERGSSEILGNEKAE